MGQKISDLKGVFGIMEEDKDVEGNKIEGLVCVNENTKEDDNGNAVTPIYVTSDTGRREVEENGNFSQPSSSEASGTDRKKRTKSKKDTNKKKRPHWVLRFNCARLKSGSNSSGGSSDPDIADVNGLQSCVCTGHRRTEDHHLSAGVVFEAKQENSSDSEDEPEDVLRLRQDSYSLDDCDARARLERAREIEEGVEPPPGFRPHAIQLVCMQDMNIDTLTSLLHSAALSALSQLDSQRLIHTQVDYIHCLVPDLLQITTSSFYWGKMDRYEAESLLEGKDEGTFLLRDSAQEEYLFSVSFRKYGRSLHARIEQWKHLFSFDSHDPGVFSAPTVCGLIEHYKDPTCCMFFEPMLTIPLHRNFAFPLQHIARAVISSKVSYDGISQLKLPKQLKAYLKEYHYKQRVKVRRFDNE